LDLRICAMYGGGAVLYPFLIECVSWPRGEWVTHSGWINSAWVTHSALGHATYIHRHAYQHMCSQLGNIHLAVNVVKIHSDSKNPYCSWSERSKQPLSLREGPMKLHHIRPV
jgi:hypothetical protein